MIDSQALAADGPEAGRPSAALGVVAPARWLGVFAVATLLIAFGGMVAALQTPRIGLAVTREGAAAVRLTGPGVVVRAETLLTFGAPNGTLTFAAGSIADDADPQIDHARNVLHWRRMSVLARMLATGRTELRFRDAQGRPHRYLVPAAARTFASLSPHFWSAWLAAMLAGLAGLWVWTIRHRDWSSRQFALMSIGLACASLPMAIAGETPLATPHYRWLLAANSIGSMLFGAGLMGMVTRFPQPLLSPRWAHLGLVACLAFAMIQALELVGPAYQLIGAACLGIFAVMLVLLLAQLVTAAPRTPERRAAMLIAASTVTTMTIVIGIVIVPIVLRTGQVLHGAFAFPLILIVHLGVAFAVTRTRLVTFGAWVTTATATTGATVLVVALDVLLVIGTWLAAGPALALGAATVSFVHIGVRGAIRRGSDDREKARERTVLRRITQLSLAIDATQRQALWTETLRLAFAPLEIAPDRQGEAARAPYVGAEGRSLHVPQTVATTALVLLHAEHGFRRFDEGHRTRAVELCALLTSTAQARDEYVRGVAEERLRIARDLHDDVGARLMTSLHRTDSTAMRQDVREAMADIRLIVSNLAGTTRTLGEVMADLRHEAATRLTAAGIAVVWPACQSIADLDDPVSETDARHLASIVRELVTNTVRHTQADTVEVTVSIAAGHLTLVFGDNGAGPGDAPHGNGLGNMTRRCEALGGRIEFDGSAGFQATVSVPRQRAPASPDAGMAARPAGP